MMTAAKQLHCPEGCEPVNLPDKIQSPECTGTSVASWIGEIRDSPSRWVSLDFLLLLYTECRPTLERVRVLCFAALLFQLSEMLTPRTSD